MFACHADGMTRRDRFRGALLGLAVGDAVGTTVEFKPPGHVRAGDATWSAAGRSGCRRARGPTTRRWRCASPRACVERAAFDPVDQLARYVRWYRDGHWSSTGRCFDIGNATRAALERFERTGEPYPGDAAPDAAGNGPLMRLAPVVLAYAHAPATRSRFAGESARTTHGAPEARRRVPRVRARCSWGRCNGARREALLRRRAEHGLHPEVAAVAAGSFLDASRRRSAAAATSSTRSRRRCGRCASTATFEAGVLAAVNLGDDADTTAAIYGQLAGALYGVEGIPARWRERVLHADEILALADALFDLRLR